MKIMKIMKMSLMSVLVLSFSYSLLAFSSSSTKTTRKKTYATDTSVKATSKTDTEENFEPTAPVRESSGTITTVYVHGFSLAVRKPVHVACQNQAECEAYWPGVASATSSRKRIVFVGYDGRLDPTKAGSERGVARLLSILEENCPAESRNYCQLVVHSMGGIVSGYVMANYGRNYNVTHVAALVSAAGGSEIANIGIVVRTIISPVAILFGVTIDRLVRFFDAMRILTVSNARASYDHNRTNGATFYTVGGDVGGTFNLIKRNLFAAIYKGDHDGVLSMHSTCGYRDVKEFTRCGGQSLDGSCVSRTWYGSCRQYGRVSYSPYSGHRVHPRFNLYGERKEHTKFPRLTRYSVNRF